ncbi:hypothetical protein HDU86_004695 [Geranomyces michiganensis]|nr:hypothetical protein HDU86_004695 [Geranomyces michiganensis]
MSSTASTPLPGYPGGPSSTRRTFAIARHADIVNVPKWKQKETAALRNGVRATVYMTNGDRYIGEWLAGMKDGNGTYHYAATGAVYQGEWRQDMRSGYGTYSIPIPPASTPSTADSKSSGPLLPSLPSLKKAAGGGGATNVSSITRSQNSAASKPTSAIKARAAQDAAPLRKVYAGEWASDVRHGRGTCFYDDGSMYDGMWEGDVREGWGRLQYAADHSVYEGEWHDGLRHGQGVLLLANGDRYEGTYLNDLKEGPGRFIYRQKRQCYEGEWALDMPKCGTLRDLPPLAGHEGTGPTARKWWPIPQLTLLNPNEVLATEREAIREDRLQRVVQGDAMEFSDESDEDEDGEHLPE